MHQLQIWKLEASAYPNFLFAWAANTYIGAVAQSIDPDIKKLLEIDVYVLASSISYQLHNPNYHSILFIILLLFFVCLFVFLNRAGTTRS